MQNHGTGELLQKFAPRLSELTKHIRDLIKEDVESVWEESVHGECFKAVKAVIASAHVLKFFDASDCAVFMSYRPNQQKEPMISHENPTRPWEKVGCDHFDFEDNNYLVCVDY